MNYTDQIEVIKDLSLDEGQSMRMDCPFCMRKNTFSISKEDSKVLWYCFPAIILHLKKLTWELIL